MVTAILTKGKPYANPFTRWSLVGFELIFAWTCALCLMFSPEYMYRSYTIAKDMAIALCIITACVAGLGFILTIYSLIWQI